MNSKSTSFLMILALCAVIIVAAVIWLTPGKTGPDEMLLQLQQTQDDGGASDLDQLDNLTLDL
ncbi:hypothetical protein HYS82_01465 [Candidatus Amesbacteria bacterium]|nr:hypothetical protein [Candidatus Amesbacteria bacterium]